MRSANKPTIRHDATSLTREFWSRKRDGQYTMNLTAKQVKWLEGLLHQMDRDMPYSHTYTLPVTGKTPLALVIYPNGAGFIKVEDFAMNYDHAAKRWEIRPEYRD